MSGTLQHLAGSRHMEMPVPGSKPGSLPPRQTLQSRGHSSDAFGGCKDAGDRKERGSSMGLWEAADRVCRPS